MKKIEFLEKARNKHGYKYEYLNLDEKVISTDIIQIYLDGKVYEQKVSKHLMGRCPEKNIPIKTTEEFIKEAQKIWGGKYDYSLVEYKGSLKKVQIIYDGIIFEQTPSAHLQGFCIERNLTVESFIKKSIKIYGHRYNYSKIKVIETKVSIGLDGIFYEQSPYNHLNGYRPENIRMSIKRTTKDFIEESNIIHYFKYSYEKTKYVKNREKVIITCPNHGDFTITPLLHLQGQGCQYCNESIGEKKITKFLKRNKINFERQKRFHDCRSDSIELPFNFYIPSLRTCIEFNGVQHYQPIDILGGVKSFENLKENNKIKEEYCEENFINLIRIKYDQVNKIQEILNISLRM